MKQLGEILIEAETSLGEILEILRDVGEEKHGGYFTIFDSFLRAPLLTAMIGLMPSEKFEKYREYSLEKATRLSHAPFDHKSSWQSRNPDKEQWGGAVYAEHGFIFSFSGLPEIADEALVLAIASNMGFMTHDEATRIAMKSKNGYYIVLREKFDARCLP